MESNESIKMDGMSMVAMGLKATKHCYRLKMTFDADTESFDYSELERKYIPHGAASKVSSTDLPLCFVRFNDLKFERKDGMFAVLTVKLDADATGIEKIRCVVTIDLSPTELVDVLTVVGAEIDCPGCTLILTESVEESPSSGNANPDDEVLGVERD